MLEAYIEATTKENLLFVLNLNNEVGGTSVTLEDYEKKFANGIKSSYVLDELEKRYEEKYFTEEDKKVVADLVEDVRKYYKEVIRKRL